MKCIHHLSMRFEYTVPYSVCVHYRMHHTASKEDQKGRENDKRALALIKFPVELVMR
uniref:Uncharacterized protein n=1 Tax=Rhizophora mucronata TaxID=61149 RepID=A0A2P2PUA1_RHIMU